MVLSKGEFWLHTELSGAVHGVDMAAIRQSGMLNEPLLMLTPITQTHR